MKKLMIVIALVAGLAVSSSARVVDGGLAKNDFKYAFNNNTRECLGLETNGVSDYLYKKYVNETANFVRVHIDNQIVFYGERESDNPDIFALLFSNLNTCTEYKNKDLETQDIVYSLAKFTHLVAEECSLKADLVTIANVMPLEYEVYSIKEAVEKLGLKCNK